VAARFYAVISTVVVAGVAACSVLTNLDGLKGPADANDLDGADADDAAPCDGGVHVTSFAGFVTSGSASIDGDTVTATITTQSDGAVSAYEERDISIAPSSVHLAYVITVNFAPAVYAEEGCTLYLFDAQDKQLVRYVIEQTANANSTLSLHDAINVTFDGSTTNQDRTLGIASAGSPHTVDVTVHVQGATGTFAATVDGQTRNDPLVFDTPPARVTVQCGISYANANLGDAGGTLTTSVSGIDLEVCP